jgi:arylformamidase
MKGYRVVELSHSLYPGREEYHYEPTNRAVDDLLPYYKGKIPAGQWYIMSEVYLWSHVGTHMEAPFHYIKDGIDIAQVPLKQVIGECAVVDMRGKSIGEPIDRDELVTRAAHIREGDIVFVNTGYGHLYRTPNSHDRPYFTESAVHWLVERQITCLGVDCSGIEERTQPRQPNHQTLFAQGIPLIEHLANLDEINVPRCFVVAVPLRFHGIEASPLSVIAFVPDAEHQGIVDPFAS